MDSITTPVILKLTNRNGNNTYMTQSISTSGALNFDYTHETGRDNDVRISLTIPKNASVPGSAVITSVSLFEVKSSLIYNKKTTCTCMTVQQLVFYLTSF